MQESAVQPHVQSREQLLCVNRLGQILGCTCFETSLAIALHCFCSESNNGQPSQCRILANHLHGFIAVHLRHHDIHENNCQVRSGLDGLDCLATSARREHCH